MDKSAIERYGKPYVQNYLDRQGLLASTNPYEARYIQKALQQFQGSPNAAHLVAQLQQGVVPDALRNNPMYDRMVTRKAQRDQDYDTAQQQLPWYMWDQRPADWNQLSPQMRQAAETQRNALRFKYFQENPNLITQQMMGQAGGAGSVYSALAGNYSPWQDKASQEAARLQALWQDYQKVLDQTVMPAGFDKTWAAIPAGALPHPNLTAREAIAIANFNKQRNPNALAGTTYNNLGDVSFFMNGPQTAADLMKQYGQQAINRQKMIFDRQLKGTQAYNPGAYVPRFEQPKQAPQLQPPKAPETPTLEPATQAWEAAKAPNAGRRAVWGLN